MAAAPVVDLMFPCGHNHQLILATREALLAGGEESREPVLIFEDQGWLYSLQKPALLAVINAQVQGMYDEAAYHENRLWSDLRTVFFLVFEFGSLFKTAEAERARLKKELDVFRRECDCWRRPDQTYRRALQLQ